MPKKVGTTQWRKQRRKEYLEKKEYRYISFVRVSKRNRYILKDLNV